MVQRLGFYVLALFGFMHALVPGVFAQDAFTTAIDAATIDPSALYTVGAKVATYGFIFLAISGALYLIFRQSR